MLSKNKHFYSLCIGLVLCFIFVGNSNVIKLQQKANEKSSIIALGISKITVQPDVAIIQVIIIGSAKTSAEAIVNLNKKLSEVAILLAKNRLTSIDIKVSQTFISAQKSFSQQFEQISVTQVASQTVTITLRRNWRNGDYLGSFLDQLRKIQGIIIGDILFDKLNKMQPLKQARKLAFEDAKLKADELASSANRKIGSDISIIQLTEDPNFVMTPVPYQPTGYANSNLPMALTSIKVTDLQFSCVLNVKFQLL